LLKICNENHAHTPLGCIGWVFIYVGRCPTLWLKPFQGFANEEQWPIPTNAQESRAERAASQSTGQRAPKAESLEFSHAK